MGFWLRVDCRVEMEMYEAAGEEEQGMKMRDQKYVRDWSDGQF